MYYITTKLPPMTHQMTLEELWFSDDAQSYVMNPNYTATRTYEVEEISNHFHDRIDVSKLIRVLEEFNAQTVRIRERPRKSLYHEFYIPKKSGGLRKIDAPCPELKDDLRRLKTIFEYDFRALYHTAAFAYMPKRGVLPMLKKHQTNKSRWFGKFDLSNFFGSTTKEFVMEMLSKIFPFSEVMKLQDGREQLETAVDLAFLDNGLPQGTPLSPTLTNIVMIPIDYKIANTLRKFDDQSMVYTRYADDFLVSSRYTFDVRKVEEVILNTLREFSAPFALNTAKTRYGSSAGRNWNFGLMMNANNDITIGYRKKKEFQAMLSSYIMDKKGGVNWDKTYVQVMDGYRNYYHMVEGEVIDRIITHLNNKFGVNVIDMIKADLKTA